MTDSEKLLALAKELQFHLLHNQRQYPPLQGKILRMALDYLKEGWAMQRDREQQADRDAMRETERRAALEADRLETIAEFEPQSTHGQKGCPE